MRNIDITEWLLNNHIDSDTEIAMNGKQFFLADVLEKHLKEQFAISDVVHRRELLLEEQSNWLMVNTSLDVEKIVDFKEHFK